MRISSDDQVNNEWAASWHIPLISALAIGVSMVPVYSLGALMPFIHASTGWSRAQISSGPSIMSLAAILLAPFVGMAIDRFGSRKVALPGLIFFCLSVASLALTGPKVMTWWLGWSLIAITDLLVKVTVWTAAVVSRFQRARGLAIGLALAGSGLASIFVPYLTTLLQEWRGWRGAYISLALGAFLLVFPVAWFFFYDVNTGKGGTKASKIDRGLLPGVPLRTAFLSRRYAQLALSSLFFSIAGTGISVHFVPILRSLGFASHLAAEVAAGIGIAVIVGRLVGGFLLDRFSAPLIGLVSSILPIAGCIVLLESRSTGWGFFAALTVGLSAGTEIGVVTFLIPRYFGVRHFGLLYGVANGLIAVGLGIGPFGAGYIFDRTGSYRAALVAMIPLFLLSGVLLGTLGSHSGLTEEGTESATSSADAPKLQAQSR